jgi:hypothetical protein
MDKTGSNKCAINLIFINSKKINELINNNVARIKEVELKYMVVVTNSLLYSLNKYRFAAQVRNIKLII